MPYPVNLLTTEADCLAVLADAAEERAEIEYRQTQLQRLNTVGSTRATELGAELAGIQTEYDNLTTVLADLPEGSTKKKNMREYKRLEYRIYLLTDKKSTGDSGVVAQFKRQYELNCLARQLAENTELRTAVEARQAAL